ncbi:DNA polymerase III, alpha subunit [Kytococcus aerolatus]|uniref:DNA polymerase III subunit alpha n=1 Tax=Kytococcus aerolatus TaxID=592308 RepID=A0A212T3P4_9MICO|nr:DNA polymerase III subunit alpha [Kytococcus aerolatus]SNC60663.1 DNA polymerase III, alpha subunit [Kytococcus aerolatus]
MSAEFAHLHVASSFSLQYGVSSPQELVDRAAAWGQSHLALTDRDGLYGAVRFAQACSGAGLSPVIGVDLTMAHAAPRQRPRSAVRGGQWVDESHDRIRVLAAGREGGGGGGVGWAALCRLVSRVHAVGERGAPRATPEMVAWAGPAVRVLLGPDSDVGRAVLARHRDRARSLLAGWCERLGVAPGEGGRLVVELVAAGTPAGTEGCTEQAVGMWHLAEELGLPVVLTAAVRHTDPEGVVVADVLDAARRRVLLRPEQLGQRTTHGHLASSVAMAQQAAWLAQRAGFHSASRAADRLLTSTLEVAAECALSARDDLGIGAVHLPEPAVLGFRDSADAMEGLVHRCRGALADRRPGGSAGREAEDRLEAELATIRQLGYPTYFLTVARVCELIRSMGGRVAARGSGAGSLVNHLLGISQVDPLRHGLLMERFCSVLRAELPDIDIDVESARRTEIYERVLEDFGADRVTCVSMMETYRVRHAVRDVGSVLGMPPQEIDALAKAFPHIRARDARSAVRELPELRAAGLDAPRLQRMLELVERLDGLPRHVALHPCGVVLSNLGLHDRTPVERSWMGFPMSQFDKDDVEDMGLLKLDVLGIRMQSAMAHTVDLVESTTGVRIDLDDEEMIPWDDAETYGLIASTRTLGCFQIESPGQRELIGKFGPRSLEDLIIDISLFRPGPVKSDMVTPFLAARLGWSEPLHLHPALTGYLRSTEGVVVFHEQVLQIIAATTGVGLAHSDEARRAMGTPQGQEQVERWWRAAAALQGFTGEVADRIWEVLASFASFGFCKAHAAAFAVPTYQSAWLKTHYPAHFLAGVLTHDPGMYPKRLILDDARELGVTVLGVDVNASGVGYGVERVGEPPLLGELSERAPGEVGAEEALARVRQRARPWGVRVALTEVKGLGEDDARRVVAGQPYTSVADFWHRARVERPVVERMILAGAFDSFAAPERRRDLLVELLELERWRDPRQRRRRERSVSGRAAQDRAAAEQGVQSMLDLPAPGASAGSGLPPMTVEERVAHELEVLGLDVSAHVMDPHLPTLRALGVTPARDLLAQRSGAEVLVAGVRVATQTPPVRSGRRVVFVTLNDPTGASDATFFEDVQGSCAPVLFSSWFLLVRGTVRRAGARGVSLRATGAWELTALTDALRVGGVEGMHAAWAAADSHSAVRGLTQQTHDAQVEGEEGRGLPLRSGVPSRKLWHSSPGSSGW